MAKYLYNGFFLTWSKPSSFYCIFRLYQVNSFWICFLKTAVCMIFLDTLGTLFCLTDWAGIALIFECKYAWADLLTKTWWKYPTSRLRKFLCKVGNCLPSWMAILRGASLFLSWCLCFGIFFAARDSCKTRNRHFVDEGIVPTCGLQKSNFQDKIKTK